MLYYKYLRPERIDVIENLKIRFTQASALNDPFESFPAIVQKSKEWYKKKFLAKVHREADKYNFRSLVKRKQYIRARKKDFDNFYECYTDEKWLFEQTQSMILMDSLTQGYLSMSSTNSSILMWSHYANNHEGYIIGFDPKHSFFQYGVSKVQYSNERPFLDPTQSKQDASLFYTKSKDWKYEEEYRKSIGFIEAVRLENGNTFLPFPDELPDSNDKKYTEVRLFSFPKESIKSVTFGWRTKEPLKRQIIAAIAAHSLGEVKIFEAKPHKFKYEMQIHEAKT